MKQIAQGTTFNENRVFTNCDSPVSVTLIEGFNEGAALTEIKVTPVSQNAIIQPTGTFSIARCDGTVETISYTASTVTDGVYSLTVSHTAGATVVAGEKGELDFGRKNLTGYTLSLNLFVNQKSKVKVGAGIVTIVDATNGIINIDIADSVTDALDKSTYFMRVYGTDASGDVETFIMESIAII